MQHAFSKSTGLLLRDSVTCEASALTTCQPLISCAAASPARISAAPESESELEGSDPGYGESLRGLLANYDPATLSWKTLQCSLVLFDDMPESLGLPPLGSYLETWPRSGMTQSGTAYRLPPLVRHTKESAFSSWRDAQTGRIERWIPTVLVENLPRSTKAREVHKSSPRLLDYCRQMESEPRGEISPMYAEWLMGFPVGWTDLED